MPLRDHFRPPLDNQSSWDELHGQWPAMIVQALASKLPARYVAAPRVHLGAAAEVDVSAYEKDDPTSFVGAGADVGGADDGGVATAVWAPPRPTFGVDKDLPNQDEYEVRVYDVKRRRRLVAAVEIISPANKDRPESRRTFVAKCAALLQQRVSIVLVDLVTTRQFNLYGDLLELIGEAVPGSRTAAALCLCVPLDAPGRGLAFRVLDARPGFGSTVTDPPFVARRRHGHSPGPGSELSGNLPDLANQLSKDGLSAPLRRFYFSTSQTIAVESGLVEISRRPSDEKVRELTEPK